MFILNSSYLKQLEDRTPAQRVHGTSEMKSSYTEPITPSRLISDKDQFKHPASLLLEVVKKENNKLCFGIKFRIKNFISKSKEFFFLLRDRVV